MDKTVINNNKEKLKILRKGRNRKLAPYRVYSDSEIDKFIRDDN